jgi:hypothetical protein
MHTPNTRLLPAAALLATLLTSWPAAAQEPTAELHFTRLQYETVNHCPNLVGAFRQAWTTDRYEAEYNLTEIVSRLTRVDVATSDSEFRSFSLMEDEIFDYPWLYAVEVGHWYLREPEAERLREYLLRGGFLMVDDFHGACEWEVFRESMLRVFPNRPIVDIPRDHEIFRLVYELDQFTQIWGSSCAAGASPTKTAAWIRAGAESTTTRDGSWSRSITIWISETAGSTPMTRATRPT